MNNLYLVLSKSVSNYQNYNIKSLSRLDIISFSTPCYIIISFIKVYTNSSAVNNSLYGLKYKNFVSLLLITNILLNSIPVRGS